MHKWPAQRLAFLFEYLREKNAVTHNPVKGVKRPRAQSGEGKTPALGDHRARKLFAAPLNDRIESKRARAILSTLLFHALRREELSERKMSNFATRGRARRRGKMSRRGPLGTPGHPWIKRRSGRRHGP
jgi:integrase/recombinase XerD